MFVQTAAEVADNTPAAPRPPIMNTPMKMLCLWRERDDEFLAVGSVTSS